MKCPVVVVDDDDGIRESIRDALEVEGYEVKTFSNGKEAFEGLTTTPLPCVILLDLMMPVMDGWEFLQARHSLPAPYGKIPIYIVSALADQNRLLDTGAAGYIRKPLDLDILYGVAQKHCKHPPS